MYLCAAGSTSSGLFDSSFFGNYQMFTKYSYTYAAPMNCGNTIQQLENSFV
jgi:hypothetical protein